MIRKEISEVISQTHLTQDIMDLRLRVSYAGEVRPGQFVSLFSADSGRLLPRPVSVCGVNPGLSEIRLVYRIAGAGTEEFSHLEGGQTIRTMGPLGNGFPVDAVRGKHVLLAGGGIGLPPMLACARALTAPGGENAGESGKTRITFAAGYRTGEMYLLEEMRSLGPVWVSTDDGTAGVRGTVIDAIREGTREAGAEGFDVIFACGPLPMLRALRDYARETGTELYLSLEERMACGVGVCLGCVTRTEKTDSHSRVKKARVCRDGPVFRAEEVDLS